LTRRLRLAEAREAQRPEESLPLYMLAADELLLETGRRAYARAVPVLKHAPRAADAAGFEVIVRISRTRFGSGTT
jgi:uncharacterized Zn finger protein